VSGRLRLPHGARVALAGFALSMKVGTQYRASSLMWTFTGTLQVVMYLSVWNAVARASGGAVGGYDPAAFAGYFACVLVVRELTMNVLRYQFPDEVRTGKLSPLLLRPAHPVLFLAGKSFSSQVQSTLLMTPVVALIVLAFDAKVDPSAGALLGGIALLPVAIVLRYLVDFALALPAFWLTRIDGINALVWGVVLILGGQFAPIAVLPEGLATIARWTPFYWALGYPAALLAGTESVSSLPHALLVMGAWIGALWLVTRWAWRRGVRHYAAVGA
jgi:ABC-2 type transport system permease protein